MRCRSTLGAIAGIAVAAAGGSVVFTGPAAAAPATGAALPAKVAHSMFFVATTSASAASVAITQKPASSIITADLINDSLGYTATAFDSTSGSEAQAASVYPGTLVTQGPSLLCSEGVLPFSCPVNPPAYPLLADASYPQHPHASAGPAPSAPGASKTFAARPAAATASATAHSASGRTGAGDADLLAGTTAGIGIGTETSRSTVVTTAHAVTVTVISRTTDISIGGLLHIGAVTGRLTQHLAAGKPVVDHPSVTISGVSVAGHAATIDNHGLHVAGHRGPAIAKKLRQRGITIAPLIVSRHDTKHAARSDATGLMITSRLPVKKTPYVPNPLPSAPGVGQLPGVDLNGSYVTTLQLGQVGAASGIERQADLGLGSLGPLPVTGRTHPGGAVVPRDGSGRGGGNATVTAPRPAPAPAAPAPDVAGAPRGGLRGFLDGDDLDLETLYLVMALGSAALFVGWRVRVATRPGGPLRGRRR